MTPVALTIAGSDPSGGAGLQADHKTFAAFGVYGASVVSAHTVQDTTGVHAVAPVEPSIVVAQLRAVLADLSVAAVKTGMLATGGIVDAVVAVLRMHPVPHLVVDPVLAATAGQRLADDTLLPALRDRILPLATLVTPNLAEASALTARPVRDVGEMRDAARALVERGARAALVTGGHLPGDPCDVLFADGAWHEFRRPRVAAPRTHGTGCTLSAAIVAALALGRPLADAARDAQDYVARALAAAPAVGRGARPLDHRVRPREP